MAIVNIKYDLSDRDDAMALQRAMYSLDMAAYIFEILMNGKRHFKHNENATIDDVFEYLWEQAREHKIEIEKIIE